MNNKNIYKIGIEREGLRCDKNGKLSKKGHPEIFGNPQENDFFTIDFGETQIELRTPPCNNVKECYTKLCQITNIALDVLHDRNEFIWPYSMPCILPKKEEYPFGKYKDEEVARYKEYLSKKYSYKKRAISGVHINFSIENKYYEFLKSKFKDLPENLDDAYMKIMEQYMKKVWMIIYLLGASPISMDTNYEISVRNSKEGFKNKANFDINYESKEEYIKSVRKYIDNKELYSLSELYAPIRAKAIGGSDNIEKLSEKINHIEVRVCDINPFDKCGVSKEQLDFVVGFLFSCLLNNTETEYNYEEIAQNGVTNKQIQEIKDELEKISKLNNILDLNCGKGIEVMYDICDTKQTLSSRVKKLVDEKGYLNSFIDLANKYDFEGQENKFYIQGYPELEKSTVVLIREAFTNGIDVDVLDAEKNIIRLKKDNKEEMIVQATRTSKDISTLQYIVNNKDLAKKILAKNGISTPRGIMFNKNDDIEKIVATYVNKSIVVKPQSTNCGVGITIFNQGASAEKLREAIKNAFEFDNNILIEEYVKGKEYRFLVINHKCIAVSWRRNASVVGDGQSTIKDLIDNKNNETWHKVRDSYIIDDNELRTHLEKNNISLDFIPPKGERVILRGNSNVSTGGETIDMTDIMPDYFKKIAEEATKCFNAKACGVDIVIDDINTQEYNILELNSNPGIGSLRWPYEGTDRRIGLEILKLLEFIK